MTTPQTLTDRLGVLTIGQAPRGDLTAEIAPLLPGVSLVEAGVLDGLDHEQITELGAPRSDEHHLTTKLRDGHSVIIGESFVTERLPKRLAHLEKRSDVVLLACTGPFPGIPHTTPLIVPDRVITHATAGLAEPGSTVGVISPLPEQRADSGQKFKHRLKDSNILNAACSPYTSPLADFTAVGRELAAGGAQIIALDCIGYTEEHRQAVSRAAQVPVLLARSAAAHFAMEMLSSARLLQKADPA